MAEKCQCRELSGYLPRGLQPPASRCGACVDAALEEKNRLVRENARLLRGDFTEEEFQNLCHNLSGDDARRFRNGCEEYQRKLFGGQP